MLNSKMGHIKELQYEVDEKTLQKIDLESQRKEYEQQVQRQKDDIWEKMKAKMTSELKLKTLKKRLAELEYKEPLNDEHFPDLCEVLPEEKSVDSQSLSDGEVGASLGTGQSSDGQLNDVDLALEKIRCWQEKAGVSMFRLDQSWRSASHQTEREEKGKTTPSASDRK